MGVDATAVIYAGWVVPMGIKAEINLKENLFDELEDLDAIHLINAYYQDTAYVLGLRIKNTETYEFIDCLKLSRQAENIRPFLDIVLNTFMTGLYGDNWKDKEIPEPFNEPPKLILAQTWW